MDKKKILDALKLIKEAFVSTPEKFKDAKLKDGVTIISYEADKLDIGVAVMAVTEQGKLPLPDGDYELEDGTKFNVATGVVTAVTPVEKAPEGGEAKPAEEGAPAAAAQMTEGQAKTIVESIIKESRFAEDIAELKTQVAEYKTSNENFATQKEEDKKTIEKLNTELAEAKAQMFKAVELMEKIAEIPSETPAEAKKPFNVAEFKASYKQDILNLTKQDKTN